MQPLTTYIEHPEQLSAEVVRNLQQLVERNPSFQTARLLYLLGLYQLQDARYGAELRKAALCLPDRRKLFDLFDNEYYKLSSPSDVDTASAATASAADPAAASSADVPADRTQSLIDSFLNQLPEASRPRQPRVVDASVDYMSYLMQLEDAVPVQNPDSDDLADDDDFVEEEPPAPAPPKVTSNDPSDTYFTETLARIYIKQGKYAKAIEIIKRISLIYPKKNRYFADQIRFLEKLIVNERALNEES